MMEVTFNVYVSTKFVGCERTATLTINLPDDATEEQIAEAKKEEAEAWMWEHIEFGYE